MNIQNIASDEDMIQPVGYNLPNLLKWSDCPYDDTVEESALPPQHQPHQPDNLSALSSSSPPPPPPPGFMQASVYRSNSNKIRKGLFDNSYSLGYKSLPIMSNYKGIVDFDRRQQFVDSSSELRAAASNNETNTVAKSEPTEFLRKSSNVTLANHSPNSGFIEVSPTSSQAAYGKNSSLPTGKVPIATGGERNSVLQKEKKHVRSMPTPNDEEENLLTSERTHFRPIKQTYTDGHTFNIPSNLDQIPFTRSASGSLYLDSEKYMEYKPIVHEDTSSVKPIIAGISLKIKVRQNEKCCQTDEISIDRHYNLSRMTRESAMNCCTSSNSGDDDAGLLTPDIEMEYEMKAYETTGEHGKHGSTLDMESWASGENKQKCLNNNNSHALWEHCSACECDNISVPANRLLKDELSADGDEIMSDLKYMQDLYIASDWEDDETDEDDDICQPLENDQNQNDETNTPVEEDSFFYNVDKFVTDLLNPETAQTLVLEAVHETNILQDNVQNLDAKMTLWNDKITDKIDQLANRNSIYCVDANAYNNNNNNDSNNNNNDISEKYIGGLWSNDENSIWRKEIQQTTYQQSEQSDGFWSSTNDNNNINGNTKQNWEHAHLEEIWNDDSKMANNADFKIQANKFQPPEHINMAADLDDDIFYDSNELSYDLGKFVDANDTNTMAAAGATSTATTSSIKKRNNSYGNGKEFQISKINRFDRKRRHSASQNMNDTHDYDGGGGDDDDGCCGACGGRISLGARITVDNLNATTTKSSNNRRECSATRKLAAYPGALNVTTIITCNLWTTTDSSSYVDEKSDGKILMNPSSILKNVAMASRPLTR